MPRSPCVCVCAFVHWRTHHTAVEQPVCLPTGMCRSRPFSRPSILGTPTSQAEPPSCENALDLVEQRGSPVFQTLLGRRPADPQLGIRYTPPRPTTLPPAGHTIQGARAHSLFRKLSPRAPQGCGLRDLCFTPRAEGGHRRTWRPASLLWRFIAERASGRFSRASANSRDTIPPNSMSSLQPPHFQPSPGEPCCRPLQPQMAAEPSAQERVTAKATPAEAMACTKADSRVAAERDDLLGRTRQGWVGLAVGGVAASSRAGPWAPAVGVGNRGTVMGRQGCGGTGARVPE